MKLKRIVSVVLTLSMILTMSGVSTIEAKVTDKSTESFEDLDMSKGVCNVTCGGIGSSQPLGVSSLDKETDIEDDIEDVDDEDDFEEEDIFPNNKPSATLEEDGKPILFRDCIEEDKDTVLSEIDTENYYSRKYIKEFEVDERGFYNITYGIDALKDGLGFFEVILRSEDTDKEEYFDRDYFSELKEAEFTGGTILEPGNYALIFIIGLGKDNAKNIADNVKINVFATVEDKSLAEGDDFFTETETRRKNYEKAHARGVTDLSTGESSFFQHYTADDLMESAMDAIHEGSEYVYFKDTVSVPSRCAITIESTLDKHTQHNGGISFESKVDGYDYKIDDWDGIFKRNYVQEKGTYDILIGFKFHDLNDLYEYLKGEADNSDFIMTFNYKASIDPDFSEVIITPETQTTTPVTSTALEVAEPSTGVVTGSALDVSQGVKNEVKGTTNTAPILNVAPTTNNTSKVSKVKKTLPAVKSAKLKGKKLTVILKKELKGVKVTFKIGKKKYSGKTDKTGKVIIKKVKIGKKVKSIKLILSKSGYKNRTKTINV